MDKPPPSGSKSSDQKQDQVTRDERDKSPPPSARAETGSVGGGSPAVPRGGDPSPSPPLAGNPKGGGRVGKSTKSLSMQGKQTATGRSSATAAGSPPAPSESPKGGGQGGKSKKLLSTLGKQPALLTGGSSAAATSGSPPPPSESPKGGGEWGKNTKPPSEREKQPALSTGGSSTTTVGFPPPPSESLQGGKAEEEGLKKKRKKAAFDAPEYPTPCSICGRPFSSWKALFGHMRTHKNRQWRGVYPPPISPPRQQVAEELASSLLNIGQRILAAEKGNEAEGEGEGSVVAEGSAVAEGNASSSAEESRRKEIHMQLDLNKKAPEGSDEECGGEGDNAGA